MKKCELCKNVARMYCDSDQASLCWDCDSRVHTANFIVAKHTRTLLCHACQSPTPWTGSGPKLGPTVSVCEACVNGRNHGDRDPGNGNAEDDNSDEEEEEEDNEENGDRIHHDDDDDSENQVVPLSLPPSLASTSSSSGESSSRRDGFSSSSESYKTSRFSYEEIEKAEEKNGNQKFRPWRWR